MHYFVTVSEKDGFHHDNSRLSFRCASPDYEYF